jgi:hypothetical protein
MFWIRVGLFTNSVTAARRITDPHTFLKNILPKFCQLYLLRFFPFLCSVTIKNLLNNLTDKPPTNSAGEGLITLGEQRLSKVIFKKFPLSEVTRLLQKSFDDVNRYLL